MVIGQPVEDGWYACYVHIGGVGLYLGRFLVVSVRSTYCNVTARGTQDKGKRWLCTYLSGYSGMFYDDRGNSGDLFDKPK